jgi:hypothetical protein
MADDRGTENAKQEAAADDVLLWRRWQAACDAAGDDGTPDFMALAALADGRLGDPEGRAALDRALALDPALADDIAAAQQLAGQFDALPAADPSVVGRAAALVPAAAMQTAEIHAFRSRPATADRGMRRSPFSAGRAVRWAALAASLAFTSYLGFALGSDTYSSLLGPDTVAGQGGGDNGLFELIDPPSGVFSGLSEVAGA